MFHIYVATVCSKIFFSVPILCCSKCFQVASVLFLDVAYVFHICCKYIFYMFHFFEMYVALEFHIAHVSSCFESGAIEK